MSKEKIIIALPKGRILESLLAEAKNLELTFEDDFFNENSRKLSFSTSIKNLSVIKVRSFDVPTIVSKGLAFLEEARASLHFPIFKSKGV